jgi:hypothetical protein
MSNETLMITTRFRCQDSAAREPEGPCRGKQLTAQLPAPLAAN